MPEASQGDAIAVVGVAGRFPGAASVDEFWRNLLDGVTSISSFDDETLRAAGVPEHDLSNPNYVRAFPHLEDAEWLDAGFFGISPREAEVLDPQHRVMLEVCHTALQHAGHEPSAFDGRIGVYAGSRDNTYLNDNVEANARVLRAVGNMVAAISNHTDYLATGVAYRLNLHGPAISVVTACSTSLVAAHQARRALLDRECDLALAGGVELSFPAPHGYNYSEGGIYSPDGLVRPFDANARGTVFGSGCGAVVLKRLDDALADNDTVHAVILGSAINNDGAGKTAFSSPSEAGQAAVVEAALRDAAVDPATIGYVEAHGTGTMVGDPLEVRALTHAYRKHTDRVGYCAISSVKANVGHLGAAAGVTGLVKAVHCVREGLLPPAVNLDEPNPAIDFESTPFYPNAETVRWQEGPRRAAVSSYGIGGTNAHMVIEQPPERAPAEPPRRRRQLIAISARTPTALDTATEQLAERLTDSAEELADVAYTLNLGRPALAVRRVAVAPDLAAAREQLREGEKLPAVTVPAGASRKVAYLFPGQGAQHVRMARSLYEQEPVFREGIDWCAKVLEDSHGLDLREALYPERDDEQASARLEQTAVAQPALFAVEHSLAAMLREWGLEPAALAGHSVGEYVAACLSGVMRPEDGLRLIAARGALMQALPGGSMLAVMLPEEHLLQFLPPELDLAAVNAPGVCAVSGEDAAVREFQESLGAQGVGSRPLRTSHAFHSRMMDPILDAFRERVAAVELSPPRIPCLSNLTGTRLTDEQAVDPDYWVRHLRSCVRFSDSLSELLSEGDHVLAEVGPGQSLSSLVRAHTSGGGAERPSAIALLGPPGQERDEVETALTALGKCWASGVPVDWKRFWAAERRGRVVLPGYPYERQRFWVEPDGDRRADEASEDAGPYYLPAWRESGPVAADPSAASADGVHWVVLTPPGDAHLGDFARRLGDAGARVTLVEPHRGPAGDGASSTPQPGLAEEWARALREVTAGEPERLRLVYGWAFGPPPPAASGRERARHWLDHGFHGCLEVLQSVARAAGGTPTDLCVVTSDMQDVTGDGRVDPAKSALLGLVTTASKEFENLTCWSVDVGLPAPAELIGEQLFAELTSESGDRQQVAYRGRKRWRWSYTATSLEAPDGTPELLKERGVYLITGGLGGLGLALAAQLAELVQARLVLTGRSGLPDRSQWAALLEQGADDPVTGRIRQVLAVEEAGGEVLVCAADVTDEARMREVKADTERRFGPVDGVFHLAGVAGGGMLETRSREDVERVLSPKAEGTYVVDEVFEPDLFVLYSSIAAISGDFGLGDYNGANAVMDAYAQSQWGSHRHVVSINWPVWAEVGMGVDSNAPSILGDVALGRVTDPVAHPLLVGRRTSEDDVGVFEIDLSHSGWVLAEHVLRDVPTMPGTGVVELVLAAYRELTGEAHAEIRNLTFLRPLAADPGVTARVELRKLPDDEHEVLVVGGPSGAAVEYARGRVRPADDATPRTHDVAAARAACDRELTVGLPTDPDDDSPLIRFGPRWHNIAALRSDGDRDVVDLRLPEEHGSDLEEYLLHPALLDTAVGLAQSHRFDEFYLPISYDRLVVRGRLPGRFHSLLRYHDDGRGDAARADVTIVDEAGRELVEIAGFTMFRVDEAATAAPADSAPAAAASPAGLDASTLELLRPNEVETAMSNAEGAETLRLILGSRVRPQVFCVREGLAERFRRSGRVTRTLLTEQLSATSRSGGGARSVATPYVEPASDSERAIAELWRDALGLDKVGAEDDFLELGGDSLVAVQLVGRLTQHFRVDVSVAVLFESRTVRSLAAFVEAELLRRVASMSDEEALKELNALEK